MKFIFGLLENRKVYLILALLNLIVSVFIFSISTTHTFPDSQGYLFMAESLLEGKFSSWYFLEDYYPETLRTPGYPVFLAFFKMLGFSELAIKVVQLLLYFTTVFMILRIIGKISVQVSRKSLFLLILLPNIQIVYFTGVFSAEILNMFCLTSVVYLLFRERTFGNVFLLGLFCYFTFIVRPVFLFFPFCIFLYMIYVERKNFTRPLLFISTFCILLIPFGVWNLRNHGVFKITPIEGGAGVAHLGYWQLKLPDGYTESFYWGNSTGHDMTAPNFYTVEEYAANRVEFEEECTRIWANLNEVLTQKDRSRLVMMKNHELNLFPLYDSKYTLEREKLLWQATKENISNDLGYYVSSRFYHLFKSYVSGINYKELGNASSIGQRFMVLYPFIVTLVFIFGGLSFITVQVFFRRRKFLYAEILVILIWYYGIIHTPFVMQARYSIPVHLILFLVLSLVMRLKEKNLMDDYKRQD